MNGETLKQSGENILNHYENEKDILTLKDCKEFSHLIEKFDDVILTKSFVEYVTYFTCRDKKITVKDLKFFINNCYLA